MRPKAPRPGFWSRHRPTLMESLSDLLVIAGLAGITAGAWFVDFRAGLVVAGLGLAGLGLLVAPRGE